MDILRQAILAFLLCLSIAATITYAGECCRTTDGDIWCDDYCCDATTLYCCGNQTRQASSRHRSLVCPNWLQMTIWGPILIGIIAVLVMFLVCFCFYKCQCRRAKESRLIVPDREHQYVFATHHSTARNIFSQRYLPFGNILDHYNVTGGNILAKHRVRDGDDLAQQHLTERNTFHVMDPSQDGMVIYKPNRFIIPRPIFTQKTRIESDNENFEC